MGSVPADPSLALEPSAAGEPPKPPRDADKFGGGVSGNFREGCLRGNQRRKEKQSASAKSPTGSGDWGWDDSRKLAVVDFGSRGDSSWEPSHEHAHEHARESAHGNLANAQWP